MEATPAKNEVLLWPPPPPHSIEGLPIPPPPDDTDEDTIDLFAVINAPGCESDKPLRVAKGGLEIHPSKVVFDSDSLYSSSSRDVQKRIVLDLQRAYARTSGGRELAVKEWADENQNRGILRLRLRCKKAKCKLQFQVNWETTQNHWFITRQCENLVHTCPPPKPSQAAKMTKMNADKNADKTVVDAGQKKRKSSSAKINNGARNHDIKNGLEDNSDQGSNSDSHVPPASCVTLEPPPENKLVTETDHVEAELLAADLRDWIPPFIISNTDAVPAPPTVHPAQSYKYITVKHVQQPAPPPIASVEIPCIPTKPPAATHFFPETEHAQPTHGYGRFHPLLEHSPLDPSQMLSPSNAMGSSHLNVTSEVAFEILDSPHVVRLDAGSRLAGASDGTMSAPIGVPSTMRVSNNYEHAQQYFQQPTAATKPGQTTKHYPSPQNHHPPVSPLVPSRAFLQGGSDFVHDNVALNYASIGANSLAMMSVEEEETIDKGYVATFNGEYHKTEPPVSNLEDGMSVLSEAEVLTIGSVSSRNWMNGVQQSRVPPVELYSSTFGSWSDGRFRPGMAHSQYPAPTMNNVGSSINHYNNNMSVNDQTMLSLTDSVRNMLSLESDANAAGMLPQFYHKDANRGEESKSAVTSRESATPQGILAADFFTPPSFNHGSSSRTSASP